jgi:hypothetical protein
MLRSSVLEVLESYYSSLKKRIHIRALIII